MVKSIEKVMKVMKKSSLIAFLESTQCKINKTINDVSLDEFTNVVYESRPDIMELDAKTPQGGIYDISDKGDEDEVSKPKNKEDEKDNEDEVSPEVSSDEDEERNLEDEKGQPLTIKSDIGFKRVEFNDAFKNINEETYQTISDIFLPDEVARILQSKESDWSELDRRTIMCKESDYESDSRKVINCFNSSNPTGIGRPNKFPRFYIDAFYKPKGAGKLKDANDRYIVFSPKDMKEKIEVLKLREKKGRDRSAIKIQLPGWENPYLMVGSDLHTKFLYKPV